MNELFTKFQTEVNQLKLKCSYCELLRSEKAQKKKNNNPANQLKYVNNFYDSFSVCLAVWLQPKRDRQQKAIKKKKKKKTNINR